MQLRTEYLYHRTPKIRRGLLLFFITNRTRNKWSYVSSYIDTIDNLYCIGRNGQHRYNNMDRSMLTAFEAVNHITGQLDNKSIIWNVNTEKEYHEKK